MAKRVGATRPGRLREHVSRVSRGLKALARFFSVSAFERETVEKRNAELNRLRASNHILATELMQIGNQYRTKAKELATALNRFAGHHSKTRFEKLQNSLWATAGKEELRQRTRRVDTHTLRALQEVNQVLADLKGLHADILKKASGLGGRTTKDADDLAGIDSSMSVVRPRPFIVPELSGNVVFEPLEWPEIGPTIKGVSEEITHHRRLVFNLGELLRDRKE